MTTDPRAVERELREAFAGATRPPPPYFLDEVLDRPFFQELDAAFRAEAEPPSTEFLGAHVHNESMRPETQRWLWGSLLLGALADPEQLLHSAVYWLRPNPCYVLTRGHDVRHAAWGRAFTPAQRRAIVGFLGLALEWPETRRCRSLASQALVWGWPDDPTTTAAAREFRLSERSYRRRTAEEPAAEATLVEVERAFADTPAPSAPLVRHICEECADYALEFAGADWRTLSPDFISRNSAAYCLFTPEAYRYFLPAALRDRLLGHWGNMDPLFHLVNLVMDPSPNRDQRRAEARSFSPAERGAIVAFLAWYQATYPNREDEIGGGLEFWAGLG